MRVDNTDNLLGIDKEIVIVNATALVAPSATIWPPGPSSRAFLRSALRPSTNPIARFTALQSRYGNAFAFHVRGRHFTMFIGPDANQYLLATNAAAFAQGASVRLGPVLGKGLLTSDGPLHATQRRLVQSRLPPGADRGVSGDDGGGDGTDARYVARGPDSGLLGSDARSDADNCRAHALRC